jgi:hypothetical protein
VDGAGQQFTGHETGDTFWLNRVLTWQAFSCHVLTLPPARLGFSICTIVFDRYPEALCNKTILIFKIQSDLVCVEIERATISGSGGRIPTSDFYN